MIQVPMSEIAGRVVSLQALLVKNEVDVAIIRQNADMYYFSGTVQDAHLIIPAVGQPVFLVRRDAMRAESQSPIRPIIPLQRIKDLPELVLDACGGAAPKRIGLELDVLPANTFFFYDEKLFPRQQIVDVSGVIRQVRMIKSAWEIEMMRRAAALSQVIADTVPAVLREGISELELSAELELAARKAGHLGLIRLRGFNMDMYFGHVLSGPEAATAAYGDFPTGGVGMSPAFGQGPGLRSIRSGEMVSVDTMMNYNGYLNDQTRNYSIGDPPRKLREGYELARSIHERFREIARPGAVTGDLYEEVWRWVKNTGWDEYFMGFGYGRVGFIGHGLGVEVDEFPLIAQGQRLSLQSGMTFAFEPKFIVPDLGIAGLENTYLVTDERLESLNTATEELVIVYPS